MCTYELQFSFHFLFISICNEVDHSLKQAWWLRCQCVLYLCTVEPVYVAASRLGTPGLRERFSFHTSDYILSMSADSIQLWGKHIRTFPQNNIYVIYTCRMWTLFTSPFTESDPMGRMYLLIYCPYFTNIALARLRNIHKGRTWIEEIYHVQ